MPARLLQASALQTVRTGSLFLQMAFIEQREKVGRATAESLTYRAKYEVRPCYTHVHDCTTPPRAVRDQFACRTKARHTTPPSTIISLVRSEAVRLVPYFQSQRSLDYTAPPHSPTHVVWLSIGCNARKPPSHVSPCRGEENGVHGQRGSRHHAEGGECLFLLQIFRPCCCYVCLCHSNGVHALYGGRGVLC